MTDWQIHTVSVDMWLWYFGLSILIQCQSTVAGNTVVPLLEATKGCGAVFGMQTGGWQSLQTQSKCIGQGYQVKEIVW